MCAVHTKADYSSAELGLPQTQYPAIDKWCGYINIRKVDFKMERISKIRTAPLQWQKPIVLGNAINTKFVCIHKCVQGTLLLCDSSVHTAQVPGASGQLRAKAPCFAGACASSWASEAFQIVFLNLHILSVTLGATKVCWF